MASPAPKLAPAELLAAIAAAADKPVTKVPVGTASNVKKSKYVGKKALAGITKRLSHANAAYQG